MKGKYLFYFGIQKFQKMCRFFFFYRFSNCKWKKKVKYHKIYIGRLTMKLNSKLFAMLVCVNRDCMWRLWNLYYTNAIYIVTISEFNSGGIFEINSLTYEISCYMFFIWILNSEDAEYEMLRQTDIDQNLCLSAISMKIPSWHMGLFFRKIFK